MEPTLRYLLDRTQISETIVRYFNALDVRDWDAMRATLADTIDLDFSALFGDPRTVHDSDDFVTFARVVLSGFRHTQHISPNHVIEIDGDRARATAYMYAWHSVPAHGKGGDTFTLRGSYDVGLVRVGDGWGIDKLHMAVWDEAGNKETYGIARKRYEESEGVTVGED
jgi:hypothetical protein